MNDMNGVVGIGCFAGEATLARVLRRVIDAYCLGEAEGAIGTGQDGSAGGRMLGRLLAGAAGADGERIAGFFLHLKDCRLDLSVFTRRAGGRCRKLTADLGEAVRLRRQRLN